MASLIRAPVVGSHHVGPGSLGRQVGALVFPATCGVQLQQSPSNATCVLVGHVSVTWMDLVGRLMCVQPCINWVAWERFSSEHPLHQRHLFFPRPPIFVFMSIRKCIWEFLGNRNY